ncbi:OPT superfamily oligopeptide transporter [Teratosphaeria nubilosa]|uniref:OPT superfamily oligopeptide transporter n=1 Tax=Teratosphaeria nubilosa TaxID=161662 RepID=A0A6G1LL47_9PEZI|nr:OPT superfamily oligopeptide transporter [Teratosphaeria nubilosa]
MAQQAKATGIEILTLPEEGMTVKGLHGNVSSSDTEQPSVKITASEKAADISDKNSARDVKDDGTEYINGVPVINTGVDVSKYLISDRDDGDPAFTFRSMVVGTILTGLSSVVTMLYQFKPYQVTVSAVFIQLLAFAMGEAWALFTPKPDGCKWSWLRSTLRFLNFGQPFGIKEHVVAALIASSGNNGLSGVEIYAVERLYYNRAVSATTAVLATFSISLCGFVVAGVLRPLIVYPSEMVYWSTLQQVVLFQRLHFDRAENRDRLVKFGWALAFSAAWEFFPAYIIPWLAGVSIFCLASIGAKESTRTVFGTIFGGVSSNEGLGLFNFGFDWQYIGSRFLSLPLKQQLNTWIGYLIWYPVMLGLYYGNAWEARDLPFMSTSLYSADGEKFSTTSILNSEGIVDEAKLAAVGLPRLTSSTVWGYFSQNLAWKQARNRTQPDPHYQGMLKYREVPNWWYWAIFVLRFFAGLITCYKGDTTLPAGPYVVSLLLGAFIAPFSAILYGLNGDGVSTNQLSKMVAGAVMRGRPLANLYFASWSHQVILLAVNLANWLKVGQYTKVPPRVMFATQVYATLLGAALNYVVMTVIVTSQRAILEDSAGNNIWSGTYMQSLNAQAITWALAKDMYGLSGRYVIVPLGLVIGLAFPVLHWSIIKVFPRVGKWPINTTYILCYAGAIYYGNTSWIWSTIVVGFVSQVVLRKRYPDIFNKYNYLIGAALDGGSQVVIFVLSFAVWGASGKERPFPTWWGNPAPGNADHCL